LENIQRNSQFLAQLQIPKLPQNDNDRKSDKSSSELSSESQLSSDSDDSESSSSSSRSNSGDDSENDAVLKVVYSIVAVDKRKVVRKQVQYRAYFSVDGSNKRSPDWVTRQTFRDGARNWSVQFDGKGLSEKQVLNEMDLLDQQYCNTKKSKQSSKKARLAQ
jgi:hypothetical protein